MNVLDIAIYNEGVVAQETDQRTSVNSMSNARGGKGHSRERSGGSGSFSANGSKIQNVKLVLLGDQGVGKSSIALRFARGEFQENSEATIGAAFLTQTINVSNKTIKFDIWDTAGQERYHSLAPMYYRGAQAAVVVFDVTSTKSFNKAVLWVKELRQQANSQIVMVLAGNKADMASDKRAVSREDAQAFAEENNLVFTESSAKTGMCVGDIFMAIAQAVARHSPAEQATSTNTVKVGKEKKKKEGCC